MPQSRRQAYGPWMSLRAVATRRTRPTRTRPRWSPADPHRAALEPAAHDSPCLCPRAPASRIRTTHLPARRAHACSRAGTPAYVGLLNATATAPTAARACSRLARPRPPPHAHSFPSPAPGWTRQELRPGRASFPRAMACRGCAAGLAPSGWWRVTMHSGTSPMTCYSCLPAGGGTQARPRGHVGARPSASANRWGVSSYVADPPNVQTGWRAARPRPRAVATRRCSSRMVRVGAGGRGGVERFPSRTVRLRPAAGRRACRPCPSQLSPPEAARP